MATGYSTVTISKALRDRNDLAKDTKELIRQKADEMGYVPNSAANALRFGHTRMLALTLVDISNPYWGRFAKCADQIANAYGYTTMIMNTEMDGKSEECAIRTAVERGVDGLIIDPSTCYQENVRILQKMGIPFVVAGYVGEADRMDAVFFNEGMGAFLAAKRFVEQGRRKLLMLNLPKGLMTEKVREAGFLTALREENIDMSNVRLGNVENGEGECIRVLRSLQKQLPNADGVLAYSDHRALEVADELISQGIRIPEDVAVIGFGDLESHLRIPYSLTTLHMSPIDTATEAMELLIKRIQGKLAPEPIHIQIPTHIVLRRSC